MTGPSSDWMRQGNQPDGTGFCIARKQWERHVAKRPEIVDALELTVAAMNQPEFAEPDPHRPDEEERRFRLLSIAATGQWQGYYLKVSVKYVQQPSGEWVKFYQSCWYERRR